MKNILFSILCFLLFSLVSAQARMTVMVVGGVGGCADSFGDWNQSTELVIKSSYIDATLSYFPVYIGLDNLPADDNGPFDADGLYPAQEGGGDIRFFSDANCQNRLAVEVVTFHIDNNPANGYCEMYVEVPSIASDSDTSIYMLWNAGGGKSQPAEDALYGVQDTWDGNNEDYYRLVLHMDGANAAAIDDSTSYNHDVTGDSGSPTYERNTAGNRKKSGILFATASSQYLTMAHSNNLIFTGDQTIETITSEATSAATNQSIISMKEDACSNWEYLLRGTEPNWSGKIQIRPSNCGSSEAWGPTGTVAETNWHYSGTAYDSGTPNNTLSNENGTTGGSWTTGDGSMTRGDNDEVIYIGAREDDAGVLTGYYDGYIDEIRISSVKRSAAWLKATYENMINPATFVTQLCQGASPSDCILRETFDGSSDCYDGDVTYQNCDNEWMASASKPQFNDTEGALQGTYGIELQFNQENSIAKDISSTTNPAYISSISKYDTGTHAAAGYMIGVWDWGASNLLGGWRTTTTSHQFNCYANGGVATSNFTLSADTKYYFRMKYTKGTGSNATIQCWTSTNGTDWTNRGTSTGGSGTTNAGRVIFYWYDTGGQERWWHDDIRFSGSEINY